MVDVTSQEIYAACAAMDDEDPSFVAWLCNSWLRTLAAIRRAPSAVARPRS